MIDSYKFKEILLFFTLFPFLFISINGSKNDSKLISKIIILNGFGYHFSNAFAFKYKLFFKLLDVYSNIIFIIYINYYTYWQPYTYIISLYTSLSYYYIWINNRTLNHRRNNIIFFHHIFMIQGLGFIGLYNY